MQSKLLKYVVDNNAFALKKALINCSVSLEFDNPYGHSLALAAASLGRKEMVSMLHDAGALMSSQTDDGLTVPQLLTLTLDKRLAYAENAMILAETENLIIQESVSNSS